MITFTIPGEPKRWQRAGKNGRRHFTRDSHAAAMKDIAWSAKKAGAQVQDVPVRVEITATFTPPKSWTKQRRATALRQLEAPSQIDVDNIAKLVLDALNEIAWDDDKRVTDLRVIKQFGETPGTQITIANVFEKSATPGAQPVGAEI